MKINIVWQHTEYDNSAHCHRK